MDIDRSMKFVKALVVIMGVMIIAAMLLMGYLLYKKNFAAPSASESAEGVANKTPVIAGIGAIAPVALGLSSSARIESVTVSEGLVILLARDPGSADHLAIYDPRRNQLTVVTAGTPQAKPVEKSAK
ncbi:putative Serine protease [Azospirillaceae bacterium]